MGRKREININESFFEKIDSEEKAYTLGFLYADGYNSISHKRIVLALKEADKDVLFKIKKALNSEHTIYIRSYERGDGYSIQTGGIKTMAYLEICSKKISDDLVRLGCGGAKTDRIRFPSFIPKKMYRHFVRGFFDGDGCIYKHKMGRHIAFIATIISNPLFIKDLNRIFKHCLYETYFISKFKTKTNTLMMGGNIKTLKFLKWLYDDCTIYLDRKFLLFQELVAKSLQPRLTNGIKTKIFDLKRNKIIFEGASRIDAAKFISIHRTTVNKYIKTHQVYKQQFIFI